MKSPLKIKLIIILLLAAVRVSTQIETPFKELKIDSLEKANTAHRKQDAEKVKLLNQLASEYVNINFDKGIETGNQAIALAQKLNKPLLLAEAYHYTALNLSTKSELEKAMELYEKALAINKTQNNKFGIAQNNIHIGYIIKRKGDGKKALELSQNALSLFEEIHNTEGIAKALRVVGVFYYSEPAKAMDFFKKSLALNEQLGNKNGIAACYSEMGNVHSNLFQNEKAIEYYQKALPLNIETGNLRNTAAAYFNIGLAYKKMSDNAKAVEPFQHALRLNEQMGDQERIADCLISLGSTFHYLSDYPKALEYCQRALRISETIGNKKKIAQHLTTLGNIYAVTFDNQKALDYFNQSLAILEQTKDSVSIAGCYNNIGRVYYDLSEYSKALGFYEKALALAEQTGNTQQPALYFQNLGATYERLADYAKAIDYYQRALHLNEQNGNKDGIARSLGNLGGAYRDAPEKVLQSLSINPGHRFELALKNQLQWLKYARESGAVVQEKDALGNISRTYELQKDFANAFKTLAQYFTLRDSIESAEIKKEITRKEMQYEFDKKETELHFQQQLTDEQLAKQQLINKQRLRLYLLGLIAFFGIIGLLATRLWYARKKHQLLQQQKEIEHRESERLAELDKLKTNLYTNITHEFRTPLTLILGPVRKMLNKPDAVSATELGENLKMVQGNGQRLLGLVNQILDLQKLEARQLKPQYEQSDVMAFLHYLADSFHSLVETKNISLTFQGQPDTLMMDYDRDKLQKIGSNLIANAIKFTPDGGAVKITAEQQDNWLEIAVTDSGIGIPKENLDTIFSLFYQVDNTSTRTQEGTGIGLTLVKELVELQGGNIRVESEFGKGSAFYVRLPIRQDAPISESQHIEPFEKAAYYPASAAMAMGTVTHDNSNAAPLILIVEDNMDVARYLGTCLETEYRIEYAANGKKGIEQAVESIPDLVISDVMMPEADGFEVCRFLKEDARTSHIPVILLTALSEVKDRLEGLRRGADAYLTKPFHEEELLITVEKLLRLRHVLRERYLGLIVPEYNREINENEIKDETQTSAIPDKSFDLLIEDAFMSKVLAVIQAHLDDSEFSVEMLNRAMGMSNTQLFRKLKVLTDLSGNQLIRQVRMARAKELLHHSNLTIAEIAYQTGFTDPSYFTRIFSRETGMTPTEFIG